MSRNQGFMMSYDKAIEWLEAIKVGDDQDYNKARVLARMKYERNRLRPITANRLHTETFGDICTCGNCGNGVGIMDEYCRKCGRRIKLG